MAKKESNRLKVFKFLKRAGGLGGTELRDRVGMAVNSGQMGIILRGEMKAGRIIRKEVLSEKSSGGQLEPSTSLVYSLTPMGRNCSFPRASRIRHARCEDRRRGIVHVRDIRRIAGLIGERLRRGEAPLKKPNWTWSGAE